MHAAATRKAGPARLARVRAVALRRRLVLAAESQDADNLVFATGMGNLPVRVAMSFALTVIAPPAPRATDQPMSDPATTSLK